MLRAALGADVGKACHSRLLLPQVGCNGAWLSGGEETDLLGSRCPGYRIQSFNE